MQGIYKDGQIELAEKPSNVTVREVLVTFLPSSHGEAAEESIKPGEMYFGMFPQILDVTNEDFQQAEFHGDLDAVLDLP